MKKYLLPLILIASFLASCSYNAKILAPEDATIANQKARYNFKAAIVVTTQQKKETADLHVDIADVHLTPFPGLYRVMQEKMRRVFAKVDVVEEKDLAREKYDVLIYTAYQAEMNDLVFYIGISTAGYDSRNGNELFKTSNLQQEKYKIPAGALIGTVVTGATLFVLSPITLPLTAHSIGSYSEEKITNLFSNSMDETVDALLRDQSLWAYAQGPKPKLKGKPVEAVSPLVAQSDVDDLPAAKIKSNKNAYAIVIGIEEYRQKLPKADFAVHDARTMTEYLTKVLGYPEENVVTLTNQNAALGDFVKYFEKWLPNNVENGSTVFVYYSGHGSPNPKTGDAYLVPYDGDPSFIDQTGYSLKRMYEVLGKLPAKKIIVALDSCFSGAGGRSVLAKGARPLVMNLQTAFAPAQNMTILAAASGDQISSTYDEKGHGLFTYFLLKGIKNEDVAKPDGSIEFDSLFSYLRPQVERIARKQYNNEQSPQLITPK
jgi:hypothetical protein